MSFRIVRKDSHHHNLLVKHLNVVEDLVVDGDSSVKDLVVDGNLTVNGELLASTTETVQLNYVSGLTTNEYLLIQFTKQGKFVFGRVIGTPTRFHDGNYLIRWNNLQQKYRPSQFTVFPVSLVGTWNNALNALLNISLDTDGSVTISSTITPSMGADFSVSNGNFTYTV